MQVTLVGKKSIHKLVLSQVKYGNYWVSDKTGENEKKLVNIEGRDGIWQVSSNNYVKIVNPKAINIVNNRIKIIESEEKYLDKIILKEYSMYAVEIGNYNELYILCCMPVFEENMIHLDINNTKEILIGSSLQNHITYKNKLVSNTHAKIYLNNGRWQISNFDAKFGTFINNIPIYNTEKILSNGDVIFIMGLKVIIMGNSIFINNPQNNVTYSPQNFKLHEQKEVTITKKIEESDGEELYSEKDYFFRSPRITNKIECEKVVIDAPPQIQDKEEMPFILALGSSLSMGVMMIVSIVSTINGKLNGTATTGQTILSLITSLFMLMGMILIPMLQREYEKERKINYEKKRQSRYRDYINSKIREIDQIMNKQKNILFNNYLSSEDCAKIIMRKDSRLWERKIEDFDFLSCRLGIGQVPLNIDIQYPEKHFTMDDDNLVEILNNLTNKSKILKDAPIALSLAEKNISAVISKDNEKMLKFMQNIIIQLITFHSYEDLKIVFLLNKDHEKNWEYVKMLPHVWNGSKEIRFFADEYSDMEEISKYLEEEFQNRVYYKDENYKAFNPYYLIITDDYKRIANLKIITEVLKSKTNLGFSLLCMTNNMMQLPNECKTFINIEENYGKIFESEISSSNQQNFKLDLSATFYFEKLSQVISNIPIKYSSSSKLSLPNNYTFLEMYDVRINRWIKYIR